MISSEPIQYNIFLRKGLKYRPSVFGSQIDCAGTSCVSSEWPPTVPRSWPRSIFPRPLGHPSTPPPPRTVWRTFFGKTNRRSRNAPVETANDDRLPAGTAARHGEILLVGAAAGRRVVELSGGPSVLVVELHREIASGRHYVAGSPGQSVRRNRMHDHAPLKQKKIKTHYVITLFIILKSYTTD